MEKEIKDLVVGDVVLLTGYSSNSDSFEKVERITSQHGRTVYVNGQKFDEGGYLRGRGRWDMTHIQALTPEQIVKTKERLRRVKLLSIIQNTNNTEWDKLPTSDLAEIWGMIRLANQG